MRMTILTAVVLGSMAGCGGSPPPDRVAGNADDAAPAQLGLCASCHGRDGRAVMANTPDLAGRDRDELLAAMQAYLDGSRDYPPMRAMLSPIRPADRERLADWYAAQPPRTAGAGAP